MAELESMNDKFSIKNILFYRAIPNYEIPIPTDGHKVYACTDCCDRFLFESSYERHVNRKSLKITYMCRHCNKTKVFLNRCNLLSHIRSHAFKTATINVSDLKVEPLPLSYFKIDTNSSVGVDVSSPSTSKETLAKAVCFDCKADFFSSGPIFKERAKHYMRLSEGVFTCPICLFAMPNECALKAHLRLHINHPPFYCPECGQHLSTRTIKYPYTHHCEGFKMMRATARMQCPVSNCNLLHPNDVSGHLNKEHVVKVFKCNACVVASYSNLTMMKHLKTHNVECKALIFYQCVLCPGRLVLPGQIEYHLKSHTMETNNFVSVYPCWNCGLTCNDIHSFLNHHIEKHCSTEAIRKLLESVISLFANSSSKRLYRVVKRCDRCLRNFTYKCKYDEIQVLPDECPYKCTMEQQTSDSSTKIPSPISIEKTIKCPCCTMIISEKWEDVKKHFSEYHNNQRCIDVKISLQRINLKQIETRSKKKRSRQLKKTIGSKQIQENNAKQIPVITSKENKYNCNMCGYVGKDKNSFEIHIIDHRDPYMAYQCMECAKCFVVKPSFSTHMLLEHNISDVDEYIAQKQCYNETALDKYHNNSEENMEPLRENQCRICRDQFDNSDDLEKHFRVHGMAFLMKNTANKSP
ncbi:zinc finger protein 687a-like [Plodia interpunctella]|uniref:zinc finger protein 687a-like n=1 Tax=Plodia interpunctella TaxID=58824 RepID=UPI0023684749|nr:zinc finger protein 687a-like [Plodia interpunctella]